MKSYTQRFDSTRACKVAEYLLRREGKSERSAGQLMYVSTRWALVLQYIGRGDFQSALSASRGRPSDYGVSFIVMAVVVLKLVLVRPTGSNVGDMKILISTDHVVQNGEAQWCAEVE